MENRGEMRNECPVNSAFGEMFGELSGGAIRREGKGPRAEVDVGIDQHDVKLVQFEQSGGVIEKDLLLVRFGEFCAGNGADFYAAFPDGKIRAVDDIVGSEMLDGIFDQTVLGEGSGSIDMQIGEALDGKNTAVADTDEVGHNDIHVGVSSCE